jgi:hypothetical protein
MAVRIAAPVACESGNDICFVARRCSACLLDENGVLRFRATTAVAHGVPETLLDVLQIAGKRALKGAEPVRVGPGKRRVCAPTPRGQ